MYRDLERRRAEARRRAAEARKRELSAEEVARVEERTYDLLREWMGIE